MKSPEKMVSPSLLGIIGDKRPKPDDLLFFADESRVKLKGEMMRTVIGLGHVPYSYFLSSSPDGLLEKSMEVETVSYNKSREFDSALNRKMAEMVARSYERNLEKGDSKILAYVVCNCFDVSEVTSNAYNIIHGGGHRGVELPGIINVGGSQGEDRDKRILRWPKDYDYKQTVGDYARQIYTKRSAQKK
jgi:hypothetical protein